MKKGTLYFIKKQDNFYEQHEIKIIVRQPRGYEILAFYEKLLFSSINRPEGIKVNQDEPYTTETLGALTDFDDELVESAMEILQRLKLVIRKKTGEVFMPQLEKMTTTMQVDSIKRAELRQRKSTMKSTKDGQITDNVGTMSGKSPDNVGQSIELRDKSLELRVKNIDKKEKEKKSIKKEKQNTAPPLTAYGEFENVMMTETEYEKLKIGYPNHYLKYIEDVSRYCKAHGKKYKDYYSATLNFLRRDGIEKETPSDKLQSNDERLEALKKWKAGKGK